MRTSIASRCRAKYASAREERKISIQHRVGFSLPPAGLLDGAALFLDLDGTLLDLIDHPGDVVADAALRGLLESLAERLEGRVAIVSGRSLAQLDHILGPVAQRLACSGSHGSEHRCDGTVVRPERPDVLDEVAAELRAFAAGREGIVVEEKSFGIALHYRLRPAVEQEALKLAWDLAQQTQLYLQAGKMMVELRTPGGDKGDAVRQLMKHPAMAGALPVFVGDDRTDEAGFAAASALGGVGVFVGAPRETAASHRLDDPAAVRRWLRAVLT